MRLREVPSPAFRPVPENRRDPSTWTKTSPMAAVDAGFLAAVQANPHLRPRVGNPDEMRSNRMQRTLDALKFRVTDPEPGVPEAIDGAVITALNEEAVASAALANKGGINIIVTYEAFGAKMHGVVRQEIIFANHCREAGCGPRAGSPSRWCSPLTSGRTPRTSSRTRTRSWPRPCWAEPSDVSRVLFVAGLQHRRRRHSRRLPDAGPGLDAGGAEGRRVPGLVHAGGGGSSPGAGRPAAGLGRPRGGPSSGSC